MLSREVVDRSAALKEGALRRRAARLAATLASVAEERETVETARAAAAARAAEGLRASPRTLAARAPEIAAQLDAELVIHLR